MSAKDEERAPAERGADAVGGGELEVGYDAAFEKRWGWAATVCRLAMAAYVMAALSGFFGHGPFSHATAHAAGVGSPSVDYEPVARYGTPTTLTFHLANRTPGGPVAVTVSMDFKVVQPLGLQRVIPRPASTAATPGGGVSLTFDVPAGRPDALVQFVAQPSTVGPVHLSARVGDAELSWTQFIVP